MIINSLELLNYRNYEELNISFDKDTNILFGDNAQGKTNILEACYMSGTSKSHKGSKDRDIIKFNCDESHIRTRVNKQGRDYQIDIHLKKNKRKGIAINKIPIKKASDLFGILNIVFFAPEDLNIIKNGPSDRRKFIDSELCQIDKIYLNDLVNYNKVLNNRNKVLKDIYYNPSLKETLDIWDEQLIYYGKNIIKRRRDFINDLNEIVSKKHETISGGKENLQLKYNPNIDDIFFADELFKNRDKDLKFGQTHEGPHRDDIDFLINDLDVKKFGSQGQQRSCALSLKLSEIDLVESTIKDKPILLLDDVMSELDSNRQDYLLNSISDVQTIITCTGLDEFINNRFSINRVYEVIEGKAYLKN